MSIRNEYNFLIRRKQISCEKLTRVSSIRASVWKTPEPIQFEFQLVLDLHQNLAEIINNWDIWLDPSNGHKSINLVTFHFILSYILDRIIWIILNLIWNVSKNVLKKWSQNLKSKCVAKMKSKFGGSISFAVAVA